MVDVVVLDAEAVELEAVALEIVAARATTARDATTTRCATCESARWASARCTSDTVRRADTKGEQDNDGARHNEQSAAPGWPSAQPIHPPPTIEARMETISGARMASA